MQIVSVPASPVNTGGAISDLSFSQLTALGLGLGLSLGLGLFTSAVTN